MSVVDIKDCFTYIDRMTKAESKVERLKYAYLQYKKHMSVGVSIIGKKNDEIYNAFMYAIENILEVEE